MFGDTACRCKRSHGKSHNLTGEVEAIGKGPGTCASLNLAPAHKVCSKRCSPADEVSGQCLLVKFPALPIDGAGELHGILPGAEGGLDDARRTDQLLPGVTVDGQRVFEVGMQERIDRVQPAELAVCGDDVWLRARMRPQPVPQRWNFKADNVIDWLGEPCDAQTLYSLPSHAIKLLNGPSCMV